MTVRKTGALIWRNYVRAEAATFYPAYYFPALTLILLASAAVRFWQLGLANLWTDEVTTALRVHAPMNVAIDSLSVAGNQTPLYFLLLPNHCGRVPEKLEPRRQSPPTPVSASNRTRR